MPSHTAEPHSLPAFLPASPKRAPGTPTVLFVKLAETVTFPLFLPLAENLEYNMEPREIPHPDIGRYFAEFAGTHYLANAELEFRYPEDLRLTLADVQKTYGSKE